MNEKFVRSLSVDLPEELNRLKFAGYFDEFRAKADYHLKREDLPNIVKERILIELNNAQIIEREYTVTEEELKKELASYCPGFEEKDFEALTGDLDYAFICGSKVYANFSVSSLFITNDMLRNWPNHTYENDSDPAVNESREMMRKNRSAHVKVDIEFTAEVDKSIADDNKLLVHLPYPSPNGIGMKNIEFVSSSQDCLIAPEETLQRTAAFSADGSETNLFALRCKAEMIQDYMSFDEIVKAGEIVSEADEAELKKQIKPCDLAEKAPHYVFSPFIKALSEKIVGDENNKTIIAKKIFDYIIHSYKYAYVRDYAAIDNLPEYFALRGRGDCGLQASLFITLCRYNGIPARWQSGIVTSGENGGAHDWAAVYLKGVGFRPVDCSFGGGGVRRGNEEDAQFYFGNIDPYRLIFNTDIQEPFNPPKNYYRLDPYDNQYGEAETQIEMLKSSQCKFGRIIHNKTIE